jgi:hypothetical protein
MEGVEAVTVQDIINQAAQGTGLQPLTIATWLQAEQGQDTATGNFAPVATNPWNIGPGKNYSSVEAGVQAFINLINSSGYYAGIRATKGQSVATQLQAIAASPFDAGHYTDPAVGTVGSKLSEAEGPAQYLLGGSVSGVATTNNTTSQSLLQKIENIWNWESTQGGSGGIGTELFGTPPVTGTGAPPDGVGQNGGMFGGLETWLSGIKWWEGLVYVGAAILLIMGLVYIIKGKGLSISV